MLLENEKVASALVGLNTSFLLRYPSENVYLDVCCFYKRDQASVSEYLRDVVTEISPSNMLSL